MTIKKGIIISTAALTTAVTTFLLVKKNNPVTAVTPQQVQSITCPPGAGWYPNATYYQVLSPVPNWSPRIRKEVNDYFDLSTNAGKYNFKSYCYGIYQMRKLDNSFMTEPTSWKFQAAIHGIDVSTMSNGTTIPENWCSCQHHNDFFLLWHRMYLFFFEKILRQKSGNPNLVIPYWDYQNSRQIPLAFRQKKISITNADLQYFPDWSPGLVDNPLYDATRDNGMNQISNPHKISMTAINTIASALAKKCFFSFQTSLEYHIHDAIHGSIGGNLGPAKTAALDPLFFSHHSNIDRLWQAWLKLGQNRMNPHYNSAWMQKTFTFYNETGAEVNMTGNQIMNIASHLNYRYQTPATVPVVPNPPPPPPVQCTGRMSVGRIGNYNSIYKITGQSASIPLLQFDLQKFDSVAKSGLGVSSAVLQAGSGNKLFLEFEHIEIVSAPRGFIAVYLVPGNANTGNPAEDRLAGFMGLFGIEHSHAKKNNEPELRIDLSDVLLRQNMTWAGLKNSTLVFKVIGNESAEGTNLPAVADVQCHGMHIASGEAK